MQAQKPALQDALAASCAIARCRAGARISSIPHAVIEARFAVRMTAIDFPLEAPGIHIEDKLREAVHIGLLIVI